MFSAINSADKSAARPHGAQNVPRIAMSSIVHENVGSHDSSRSHTMREAPIVFATPSIEIRI
jgi:hypothetical protein